MEIRNYTASNASMENVTRNISEENSSILSLESQNSFFDTYYSKPRFVVESILAFLAFLINCLALLSSAHARNKRYSIYHILFINLCVCNALSLSLSWISNNTIFLFSDRLTRLTAQETGLCKVYNALF